MKVTWSHWRQYKRRFTHRHGGLSKLEVAIGEGGLVRAAQGRVSKITVNMVTMTFYEIGDGECDKMKQREARKLKTFFL